MKKVLVSLTMLLAMGYHLAAQPMPADSLENIRLEEVVVSATRAGRNTPVAYRNISAQEIKQENAANNLPLILQTLPHTVGELL